MSSKLQIIFGVFSGAAAISTKADLFQRVDHPVFTLRKMYQDEMLPYDKGDFEMREEFEERSRISQNFQSNLIKFKSNL